MMRCMRFASKPSFIKSKYQFSKNSPNNNSKNESLKNQNYIKSRTVVPKNQKQQNQILKKMQPLNRDQELNIKRLIMSNIALVGIIPLWQPIGIAITLLNGGYLLNSFSYQFKRYLLVINNNQWDLASRFRGPQQFLRLFVYNFTLLSCQSVFLAIPSYEMSYLLTVVWFGVNIHYQVIPKTCAIIILPLLVAILINTFAKQIKAFLLDEKQMSIDLLLNQNK